MSGTTRVGYQGEPGAFSETAVLALFPSATPVPHHAFRDVFHAVERGAVDFGMMPIENSQAGSINDTYDLLASGSASIVAEVIVPVHHALLALPGTSVEDVHRVISHPQALAQCQDYLERLDAEVLAVHDTAGAARMIAESGSRTDAAIASVDAGSLVGLTVLAERIQTEKENFTKFAVIGSGDPGLGPHDKTSLVMAVLDEPGSLLGALQPFAQRGINMHKIESRPRRGKPFEYVMYVDVMCAGDEPGVVEALDEVAAHTSMLRVLGSYRAAADPE